MEGETRGSRRRKRQKEKRRLARAQGQCPPSPVKKVIPPLTKQEKEAIPVVKKVEPITKIVLRRPKAVLIRGSIDNPAIAPPKQ